jgi:hypothetical protein
MGLASQCEGRYGSDFPTFCPYTGHHTTRRDLATTLLAKQRLPRCSPAWGHSRNQKAKNASGDATTLLACVERWSAGAPNSFAIRKLRPNDYAFKITYNFHFVTINVIVDGTSSCHLFRRQLRYTHLAIVHFQHRYFGLLTCFGTNPSQTTLGQKL